MMKDVNKYHKGSEWRKWDLHVHTPSSIVQNYGGDVENVWEKFITDLENLPQEFKVIGINDYLFLDGYKKVLEYQKNGRLKNLDLILPVLEFRIKPFCGKNIIQLKRPNIHVVFSNEINLDDIQSQFLNTLDAKYCIDSDGKVFSKTITKKALEDLGQEVINMTPDKDKDKNKSPLEEGFNNLNLDIDKIKHSLDKDCFTGKYLVAIGKTEWSEIKWSDDNIVEKKNIINQCTFVFTAAENIDKFNNAKQKLTEEKVNNLLLDCSDAHSFSNSQNKDRIGNCMTWIKADPTFEGLKIALLNPKERIYIGDEPEEIESHKMRQDKIIEKIKVVKTNDQSNASLMFEEDDIIFNSGLVAIIGGQGSGKSALLDIIARGCGMNDAQHFAFLKEERFLSDKSNKHCNIKLKCLGDKDFNRSIPIDSLDSKIDFSQIKIDYITQNYFRDIESEKGDFENRINEILFNKACDHNTNLTSYKGYKEYQSAILSKENMNMENCINNVILYRETIKSKDSFLLTAPNDIKNLIDNFNAALNTKENTEKQLNKYLEDNPGYKNINAQNQFIQNRINEITQDNERYNQLQKDIKLAESEIQKFTDAINASKQIFISNIVNAANTFNNSEIVVKQAQDSYKINIDEQRITIDWYIDEINKLIYPSTFATKIHNAKEKIKTLDSQDTITRTEFAKYEDIETFFNRYKNNESGLFEYKDESRDYLHKALEMLRNYQNKLKTTHQYILDTQKTIEEAKIRCNKLFGMNIFSQTSQQDNGFQNNDIDSILKLYNKVIYFNIQDKDEYANIFGIIQKEYRDKLQRNSAKKYENEINELTEKIKTDLRNKLSEIFNKHSDFEKLEYETDNNEEGSIISIKYKPCIKKAPNCKWLEMIKENKNPRDKTRDDFYAKLNDAISRLDYNNIENSINNIVEIIISSTISSIDCAENILNIKEDEIKKEYSEDFINELIKRIFKLEYITFEPILSIKIDDNDINTLQMSLGQKTEAILKLYLQAGNNNNYPILIDQPESNLENKVMSKNISRLLKSASKKRQIFVVTHSPNIAILSDADQIIRSELCLLNKHQRCFKYTTGAIESKNMIDEYIDILEGGKQESFNPRKLNYESLQTKL